MTTTTAGRMHTPAHLWIVGAVTLLFNAMGIISYMTTKLGMLAEMGLTPSQIAFMESYPAWVSAFWALGVWGAFAGSVLLLLRSKWTVTAMVAALVGLIVVTVYHYILIDVPADMQSPGLDVAIWVVTLFLLFYSRRMVAAGVLR
ncbi:hypothetical protein [Erythrobacter sp. BLCC-B19]|uniref:hypothetical protein n=1 Tax=Erythrobacter sp. BLCC-B19 TaxID=3025315 RepID=UPI00235F15E9|nr:hypothetical protein [Erythrobacter sp. BLCC-B19]WDA39994.1 hypothetical protein PS060_10500 [Erythrobacter sp. BLCC-B19]